MKINSIQVLRAVAVILVTHAHSIDTQMAFSRAFQDDFFYLQNLGAIGVDLFFVISGFIICYVASKYQGVTDGFEFLKKRFFRINPVYYVASILALLVTFLVMPRAIDQGMMIRAYNSLVILPIIPAQAAYPVPILSVGWSLSFEWFFYVLFFCTILMGLKNKVPVLALIIISLVVFGRLYHPNSWVVFYTNPLLLEFMFGTLVFWMYNHVKLSKGVSLLLIVLGISGYIFNIFHDFGTLSELNDIYTGVGMLDRVLLWGVPSLFLFTGCVFMEKAGGFNKIWNNSLLLYLGNGSYSIYLVHTTVNLILATQLYARVGFFLNPDLAVFVQMIIGIMGGLLFYQKVEKPVIAYFHPPMQKQTA
ncbi:acyltransferase [Chitinophaga silvatica]|uniref:Acyltransferase n=1 Tax=Chitinophaga silvatica TaxID=2282649 RepID=A0A3E1YAN9_9BACT|nr:acyltransferase [Chitinophaga silvatica]RFS22727.1 acyltransferase [Chitinophaga silvatica]